MIKTFEFTPQCRFVVTGVTYRGKRFRIETANWFYANGINLWRGNVWHIPSFGPKKGKRVKVKEVFN